MTFEPDWLALREPFDHAARSVALGDAFAEAVTGSGRPPHLVELAGGTGSGIRWLEPRLPSSPSWWLVDHDPALLALVDPGLAEPVLHDLRHLRALPLRPDGVSCQALLDLVDDDFLVALADWVTDDLGRVPVLAALTVDGRVDWSPADPHDDEVQAAFRLHQRMDRGFGASVGTFAAPTFADLLRVRGYRVQVARADWEVPPDAVDLLAQMVAGTAAAAAQVHPDPDGVAAWRIRREAQLAAQQLGLTVGHLDVLGLPPG